LGCGPRGRLWESLLLQFLPYNLGTIYIELDLDFATTQGSENESLLPSKLLSL